MSEGCLLSTACIERMFDLMKRLLSFTLVLTIFTGLLPGIPLTVAAIDPYEMIIPSAPLSGIKVSDYKFGNNFISNNYAVKAANNLSQAEAKIAELRNNATVYFTAGFQVNVPSTKVTTMAFKIDTADGNNDTAALYGFDLPSNHGFSGITLPTISYTGWQNDYSGFIHNVSDNYERDDGVGLKNNNDDLYAVVTDNGFEGYWSSPVGRNFASGVHNTTGITSPKKWEFEFYFFAEVPGVYELQIALASDKNTDGDDGILAVETITITVNEPPPPKSATPTASVTTVAKTSEPQIDVDFALTSTNDGNWKVYANNTTGTPHSTVTADFSAPTLRLSNLSTNNIAPGTYYVSVTESGKTESDRLALTVGAFVPPTFAVTVTSAGTGATGAGSYAQGANVNITAGTPPSGQIFINWTTTSSGVSLTNANSASTSFTMPANAVTVTANFETVPPFSAAKVEPQSHIFPSKNAGYNNVTEVDLTRAFEIENTGTMPITGLTAVLSNTNFTVSTPLTANTIAVNGKVSLAIRPAPGLAINTVPYTATLTVNWTENPGSPIVVNLSFTVSDNLPHILIIQAGVGGTITKGISGQYLKETIIDIAAAANNGFRFNGWTSSNGGLFANANHTDTKFSMPNNATIITANFVSTGFLYGDLNGDGKVDSADLVLMLRYFARPGVEIDLRAADVNGDGVVNMADLILLLRYFSQPNIVLGPSN
jgi:hypothetical protein